MLKHFRALMVAFILVVSGVLMGCEAEATVDVNEPDTTEVEDNGEEDVEAEVEVDVNDSDGEED